MDRSLVVTAIDTQTLRIWIGWLPKAFRLAPRADLPLGVLAGVVAFGLDAVAQRCLHAALRRTAVAAPRRHQRENQDVVPGGGRLDGTAFAGKPAADDQYVGTDE
mgnify:CR=1 FL=1